MLQSEVYLVFDSLNVILFVGRECAPSLLQEIFEVSDVRQINLARTEEQIFSAERQQQSRFLSQLYAVINNVRY